MAVELAGPGEEALAPTEAGHHGEGLGEAGPQVSARCVEVLEAVGQYAAEADRHLHWVVAGRKGSEADFGERKGWVLLAQHKG